MYERGISHPLPDRVTSIDLPHRRKHQLTREKLAARLYDPEATVHENEDILQHLVDILFGQLDKNYQKENRLPLKKLF